MLVRPATVGDAPAIAMVHVASWQAACRDALPDPYLDDLAQTMDRRIDHWAATAVAEGEILEVIESANEIVGFASWGPARDGDHTSWGELRAIYLHPSVFGRGAGRALHESGVAAMVHAGYRDLLLWVHAANRRAIDFYSRHGWRPDGGTDTHPIAEMPLPVLRMVRSVGG